MKYNVGDKVEIVSEEHWHQFPIGTIVEIKDAQDGLNYWAEDENGEGWYVEDDEIKLSERGWVREVSQTVPEESSILDLMDKQLSK